MQSVSFSSFRSCGPVVCPGIGSIPNGPTTGTGSRPNRRHNGTNNNSRRARPHITRFNNGGRQPKSTGAMGRDRSATPPRSRSGFNRNQNRNKQRNQRPSNPFRPARFHPPEFQSNHNNNNNNNNNNNRVRNGFKAQRMGLSKAARRRAAWAARQNTIAFTTGSDGDVIMADATPVNAANSHTNYRDMLSLFTNMAVSTDNNNHNDIVPMDTDPVGYFDVIMEDAPACWWFS